MYCVVTPTDIEAVAKRLSDVRALAALLQEVGAPALSVILAVLTDEGVSGPIEPDGVHPQRFAIPPPPQNCGAAQLFGHASVVLHALSVPHHVGSHCHPHRFGVPAPPQICPLLHVPHWRFVISEVWRITEAFQNPFDEHAHFCPGTIFLMPVNARIIAKLF
jgi:hypothetical protein